MMKIGICDDDSIYRERVKKCLEQILADNKMRAEIMLYSSAQKLLESPEICNLLFLDIEMPDKNGMQAARVYKENNKDTLIVFLTSHSEYSMEGYKVSAFRFIEKNDNYEDLKEAVLSARMHFQEVKSIKISISNSGYANVKLDDIQYIEVTNRKTIFHLLDQKIISTMTISSLSDELKNTSFFLVHRAFLVNVNYVFQVKKKDIVMKNGDCVPLSEKKQKEFNHFYFQYMFERGNR